MRCAMPSTPVSAEADLRGAQLLALAGLSVRFASSAGTVNAVEDLTLSVARGECLGVVGESGAGKSQAFLAPLGLSGASAQVSGSARFAGTELLHLPGAALDRIRGAGIGIVFQDPMSSLTPHLRVGAQIAEVLMRHRGASRTAARSAAIALLERVHVNDPARRATQYPHELSGGMRQRVMIAIALSAGPQLLIADEPTTALDVTIQAQILALLGELKRAREMALVLITHDVSAVAGLADRVAVLKAGRLVEEGPVRQVLREPRDPYTRSLVGEGAVLAGNAPQTPRGRPPGQPVPLSLEAVSVRFPLAPRWLGPAPAFDALREVRLSLGAGETLGIVGESGGGKSTLARVALALLAPSAGRVVWSGTDVHTLGAAALRRQRRDIQIIFQDPLSSLDPRLQVQDILAEPLQVHAPGLAGSARAARVQAALAQVALPEELLGRYPHELSGGQCQRVGIARAMILKPSVLVCDEPLSALDTPTQAQIVRLLAALRAGSGMSLLFISHNLQLVRRLCTRVLVLYLGRMMELADAASLYVAARHPYTRELIQAIPGVDPDRERARLSAIAEGEPASPGAAPSGCVYRTRCPYVLPVCIETVPPWEEAAPGHFVACHRQRELA
jgi:peptide/nickel transport system ATP-binding protein